MSENQPADAQPEAPAKPFLRIVKGNPSDVEVATLTALFAGMANAAAESASQNQRETNMWGNVEERLRRPSTYNPSAFRNATFY